MTQDLWWPSPYGSEDQIGMLNEITPHQVVEAARLVQEGRVYDLGRVLDENVPAFAGRSFRQSLITSAHLLNRRRPDAGLAGWGENDVNWVIEIFSSTSQLGTHLDALNHLQIGDRLYNGHRLRDIAEEWGTNQLGVETVPQIISRGVLVDVAKLHGVERLEAGYAILVSDVTKALEQQAVEIRKGDAVLFHTGWGDWWMKDSETYLSGEPGPGLELALWLVEKKVALTGCDTWSFGPVPGEDPARPFEVPQTLNVRHGLFIVENLFTQELANAGVYEFLFILTHAKVRGATGAWVSPVAIH
ncbi:MAG: cyclase family protein [Acidobacteria bacterium]|nr:cyclase family protein [Acidobacteriota bacterium]MCZ6877082.1 cyclase family protein [Acidobacteriota bacterium]